MPPSESVRLPEASLRSSTRSEGGGPALSVAPAWAGGGMVLTDSQPVATRYIYFSGQDKWFVLQGSVLIKSVTELTH